ncbi:MAG: hypothetical protein AVDCRST_MAG64-1059, partial [uncultured Phycisphaerae bacterium]
GAGRAGRPRHGTRTRCCDARRVRRLPVPVLRAGTPRSSDHPPIGGRTPRLASLPDRRRAPARGTRRGRRRSRWTAGSFLGDARPLVRRR